MPKKNFQNLPKPKQISESEIDAFVQSGPGQDNTPASAQTLEPENEVPREDAILDTRKPSDEAKLESATEETSESADTETSEPAPIEIIRFSIDIPRDLHRRYKAHCSLNEITMRDDIEDYIRALLNDVEKE